MAKLSAAIDASGARSGSKEFVEATAAMVDAARKSGRASAETAEITAKAKQKEARAAKDAAAEAKAAYQVAAKAAKDSGDVVAARAAYIAGIESNLAREQAEWAARVSLAYAEEASAAQKSARAQVMAAQETAAGAKAAYLAQNEARAGAASSAMGLYATMGLLAAGGVATSVVKTIASYEGLKSALITATKSADGAQEAFVNLQKFADQTPYTLEEATKAYIRMSSAGLKPSIEALTDFGDIASAIPGKTILDFVEAVADGTQGQGRRLKEFGIGLHVDGDKAKVTFGKMALSVKNDAASIEAAIRKISVQNFGGSMERQSKTLAGTWSTLEDKAAGLAMEIGEGGLLSAMKDVVQQLTATTSTGKDTARAIGEVLGDAVRATAAAAQFLAEHMGAVKALLVGFVAYEAVIGLAAIAGAFVTVTTGVEGATIALVAFEALTPVGWAAIAIAGIAAMASQWERLAGAMERTGGGDIAPPPPTVGTNGSYDAPNPFASTDPEEEAYNRQIAAQSAEADAQAAEAAAKIDPQLRENFNKLALQGLKIAKDTVVEWNKSSAAENAALEVKKRIIKGNQDRADAKPDTNNGTKKGPKVKTFAEEAADLEQQQAGEFTNADKAKRAADEAKAIAGYTAITNLEDEIALQKKLNAAQQVGTEEYKKQSFILPRLAQLKSEGVDEADALAQLEILYATTKATADLGKAREDAAKAAEKETKENIKADKKNKNSLAEFVDAFSGATNQVEKFRDLGVSALQEFASTMADALVSGKADWKSFFQGIEKELVKLLIQLAEAALIKAVLSGGTSLLGGTAAEIGGMVFAGLFHDGGAVGGNGGPSRAISPATFIAAPRYHNGGMAGLRPDEVPAILQTGERVLSRSQTAADSGGKPQKIVNIHMHLPGVTDARGFGRSAGQQAGYLRRLLGEDD